MTDNRTTEMREKLTERGVEYEPTVFSTLQTTFAANGVEWIVTEREATGELFVEPRHGLTPDQAIAATLGSDRDEIYNAGFDSGIKATLQQLDGLIVSGYDIKAICAWIDEQWKRYES